MAEKDNGSTEVETEETESPSIEETALAAFESVEAREADDEAETEETESVETEKSAKPAARTRGKDGKFVAGKAEEAEAETTEQPDTALETEGEATAPIAAPPSMSAAEKAAYAKLSPEMQAFVARRESDVTKRLQAGTQTEAELKRRYDSIEQVLSPRRQQFAMMGVSEAQAIAQLLALSDFATNDIAGFIKYMAVNRGVDLRTLIEQPGQQAQPVDPALAATQRTVQQLEHSLRAITEGQAQAQQQQVNNEIESFRNAKGANGQPAHPHFDAVKVAMGALMQSGQADDLQTAYDMAVHANPTTRAQLFAEQRAADEAKRVAEAKAKAARARQAQGTVLTPKGTTPGKPAVKSLEETAREAYERINGAAA